MSRKMNSLRQMKNQPNPPNHRRNPSNIPVPVEMLQKMYEMLAEYTTKDKLGDNNRF